MCSAKLGRLFANPADVFLDLVSDQIQRILFRANPLLVHRDAERFVEISVEVELQAKPCRVAVAFAREFGNSSDVHLSSISDEGHQVVMKHLKVILQDFSRKAVPT